MIAFFRRHPWRIVLLTTWGAWFFSLWPRWFWINNEGVWAGQPFIWADWSVHLTYISRFLFTPAPLWFSHHPVFALERWTYPPLPNLLSAALAFVGVPLGSAMLLPVIVATAALLLLLFHWFGVHKLSERASFVGTTLFLLSGAWGWPIWLKTVLAGTDRWAELQFPSRLYTQIFENHLVWLNPIAGMVLPQRSFTIGFPILLWILISLRQYIMKSAEKFSWRLPIQLAVLSLLLLLTHTHSFLALGILCMVWFCVFPKLWRFWLSFGTLTALLALPWYWFILRGSTAVTAFSLDWGWMSPEPFSPLSWAWFWLKNWGFVLPLALIGWWADRKESFWLTGFFALFLFANVVRTQSYDWDNAKLLIIALVGFLPAMLTSLQYFKTKLPRLIWSPLVIGIILLSIWGGALEAIRISQPARTTWRMSGPEEAEFARQVREVVPANEVVLTSDLHNHPVPMLSGRPVLLGYIGWVWSYGFKYDQVQADVKTMYTDSVLSNELRHRYGIRFVVVGPHERTSFAGYQFLAEQCVIAAEAGDYWLLQCE